MAGKTRITAKQKAARRRNIKVAQAARKKSGGWRDKRTAKIHAKRAKKKKWMGKKTTGDRTLDWLMSQPKGEFRGHQ